MKYYAVIDTNVLVSAMLRWDSVPGKIMEHVFVGEIIHLLKENIENEREHTYEKRIWDLY